MAGERSGHTLEATARSVLYTISTPSPFEGQTAVLSLSTGETHVVLDRGVDARYVPSGHLVYVNDRTLMAVPFDVKALRVTGTPTAIIGGVIQAIRTSFISVFETRRRSSVSRRPGPSSTCRATRTQNRRDRWCGSIATEC
jgi:serine/threonine-protein kinase